MSLCIRTHFASFVVTKLISIDLNALTFSEQNAPHVYVRVTTLGDRHFASRRQTSLTKKNCIALWQQSMIEFLFSCVTMPTSKSRDKKVLMFRSSPFCLKITLDKQNVLVESLHFFNIEYCGPKKLAVAINKSSFRPVVPNGVRTFQRLSSKRSKGLFLVQVKCRGS